MRVPQGHSSVVAGAIATAHFKAGDEILKNTFANNGFEHFRPISRR